MASASDCVRWVAVLMVVLVVSQDSLQATLQVTPHPNDDNPFGNECDKNGDCSCMSGGVPLCYGGYCHCIYSANIVCARNPCGQLCPSGIGVCLLDKCLCYKLVQDSEVTDIDLKPELLDHTHEKAVPSLLK